MKTRILVFSVASALCFAIACGDDDDTNGSGNTGGVGGEAGNGAETGGTTHTGGVNAGGAGDAGGAGGAGDAPVTCEAPEPPNVGSSDAGGAGGGGGASGEATSGGAVSSGLAIEGSFVDNYMGHHTVTSSAWTSGKSVYHIAAFDNAEHFIIARNDEGNMYSPCLWSRFDWTESAGVLYYCQSVFGAESQAAALASPAADPSDLSKGCSNFPWSSLTAE